MKPALISLRRILFNYHVDAIIRAVYTNIPVCGGRDILTLGVLVQMNLNVERCLMVILLDKK